MENSETVIYLDGKEAIRTVGFIDVSCDMSELYNFICRKFPENNWTELVCDSIKKIDNNLCIYVSTKST